ncbi:MAG: Uma2 family endonuclease [Acidobacteriota bacterium]|nr:Uma2 family endonuclease [Acidobacteriota bacterium]
MGSELKQKLDYSDYVSAPDDGNRYEILRGTLLVTPAPSPLHQRISRRLERWIEAYFHGPAGEMFHAPIDLILASGDIVQPDIVVVADPAQVSDRGIEGPPLIVVEILSPSTRERDLGLKAQRYAELGVPHYWTVDPEARRLDCHRLKDGRYRRAVCGQGRAVVEHPDWEGLVLDLAELWVEPEPAR